MRNAHSIIEFFFYCCSTDTSCTGVYVYTVSVICLLHILLLLQMHNISGHWAPSFDNYCSYPNVVGANLLVCGSIWAIEMEWVADYTPKATLLLGNLLFGSSCPNRGPSYVSNILVNQQVEILPNDVNCDMTHSLDNLYMNITELNKQIVYNII